MSIEHHGWPLSERSVTIQGLLSEQSRDLRATCEAGSSRLGNRESMIRTVWGYMEENFELH